MKIKQHPNGIYYAHLTGGISISLKTRNKEDAQTAAREAKLAELEQAKRLNLLTAEAVTRLTAGGRVTGAQAVEAWASWADTVGLAPNTVARYRVDIDGFLASIDGENKPLARATDTAVDAFVNPEGELSASTRRNRLSALQSFFAVAVAKGFSVTDPTKLVRVKLGDLTLQQKEAAVREPFTDSELKILRSIEDPFWATFLLLVEHHGFRLSDVAQLEWASIRKDTLLVWTDKRDVRLELPLSAAVREHLMALPKLDPDYVFPAQAKLASDPKRRSTLPTYFSRLLKRQGIHGKNTHAMRHTFATKRSGLGDTVDQIRRKLGHAHVETTEGYIHAAVSSHA